MLTDKAHRGWALSVGCLLDVGPKTGLRYRYAKILYINPLGYLYRPGIYLLKSLSALYQVPG